MRPGPTTLTLSAAALLSLPLALGCSPSPRDPASSTSAVATDQLAVTLGPTDAGARGVIAKDLAFKPGGCLSNSACGIRNFGLKGANATSAVSLGALLAQIAKDMNLSRKTIDASRMSPEHLLNPLVSPAHTGKLYALIPAPVADDPDAYARGRNLGTLLSSELEPIDRVTVINSRGEEIEAPLPVPLVGATIAQVSGGGVLVAGGAIQSGQALKKFNLNVWFVNDSGAIRQISGGLANSSAGVVAVAVVDDAIQQAADLGPKFIGHALLASTSGGKLAGANLLNPVSGAILPLSSAQAQKALQASGIFGAPQPH